MDNEFYTLLTDRGMAKIASALADKKQLHLQKMAVGDGGGQYYEPTASQPASQPARPIYATKSGAAR